MIMPKPETRAEILERMNLPAADGADRAVLKVGIEKSLGSIDPRAFLPNAFIQAVAYRGENIETDQPGGYQLDALDASGPLDEQIVDACRFVYRNMRTAAVKDLGRTDIPQYSMRANVSTAPSSRAQVRSAKSGDEKREQPR